jgi:hypothetical protein
MRKLLFASAAAVALTGATIGLNAFAAPSDAPTGADAAHMQRMEESRAIMLDAHLAGMKAGLKLTPDEEKNWPAFETAIRDASKAHAEAQRQMREHREAEPSRSPIEHMAMMSERLQKISSELKAVADAGKPLYDSLDEQQKRHFGPLLRDFLPRGPHAAAFMRHRGPGPDGEDGPGGME